MKNKTLLVSLAVSLGAFAFTGCDNNKTTGTGADTGKMADAVKDAAGKAMDTVTNAVGPAAAQFTDAVAAAKKALDEKNYQGALDELKKLSDVKLSPEQQKIVDGIKEQAQKLLANGAAAAADAAKNIPGK